MNRRKIKAHSGWNICTILGEERLVNSYSIHCFCVSSMVINDFCISVCSIKIITSNTPINVRVKIRRRQILMYILFLLLYRKNMLNIKHMRSCYVNHTPFSLQKLLMQTEYIHTSTILCSKVGKRRKVTIE